MNGEECLTLALRVLGSFPSPLQSVLLPLLHPRVAGQQAGFLQRRAEVRVEPKEGAGDAMRDRAGLSARSTADDLDGDVELALRAGDTKWRQRRHLEDAAAQVREGVLLVHRDTALARGQADPRDRVLAPA